MPWEKQFDVEDALEKAGEVFWAGGYEATSMSALLKAMGIQKGSFYDTYGSKREVYLRALEQYVESRFTFFQNLTVDKEPRAAIKTLLKVVFDDCTSEEGHRGCMVVNCALELAHDDDEAQAIVQRSFGKHEKLFADQIRRGQKLGTISAEVAPAATGKALMAFVMGMRVYSRSGTPKATLKVLLDQALRLIER